MFVVTCKACWSEFGVQVNPSRVQLVDPPTAAAKYCVYCGTQALQILPHTGRSLWRDIAIDAGMPDTDLSETLVHALWEAWAPREGDAGSFRKFVDDALREN